ncbi:uncharacterized protein LOC111350583 [Spodoptera litura]|uniref:Uncharacterized protein LOC111350583 n=1 Tax=Spodoptera litura TaxID=69820 RepID=A0A9J7IM67_SPOLT|nr:uncharacterized protein LOC111350583 [Spodoptera litura]
MSSGVVKCASCNVVINEILAFICNKIDVMDEESISRICVSAFSENDILKAKNLLFDSVTTTKQKKIRKKQGKTIRNIDDIVCLLKETDPEDIPIFVARDLQKLPPVLFDHVDVTRILKDIVKMRSDLDRICEEYATLEQMKNLRVEVESLKNASIVNNFQRNVNTKRGAASMLSSFEYESGPMGLSPLCNAPVARRKSPTVSPAKKRITFSDEGTLKTTPCREPNSLHSDGALKTADTNTSSERAPPAATAASTTKDSSQKSFSQILSDSEGEFRSQPLDDGFILVQRKRLRNRFQGKVGKGNVDITSNFRAADVKVPIYIYNVSKETSTSDIKKYVTSKINIDIDLQKMNMKIAKDYNAYKIFVPKNKLNVFLRDDFWPSGVMFRRFVDFSHNSVVREYRDIDKTKLT